MLLRVCPYSPATSWDEGNPCSKRIVEDIECYPLVIGKMFEHKGGVIPDWRMQHQGCSKRKRKVNEPSLIYTPTPRVAEIARPHGPRQESLRQEAKRQSQSLMQKKHA